MNLVGTQGGFRDRGAVHLRAVFIGVSAFEKRRFRPVLGNDYFLSLIHI